MAAPGSSTPGKKDRREEAREKARIEREAEKKRQRRNKIFLQGGIGAAVIAIVVVIVLVVVGNTGAGSGSGNTSKAPKNLAGAGILFTGKDGALSVKKTAAPKASVDVAPKEADPTAGVANIVTYIDWACPICQSFEKAYSSDITDLVKSGKATLDIHPISIVDRSYLSSRYASRAANAAMCVANFAPDKFLDAQTQFYDNQPAEGSNGLTNAQIKGLLKDAGVGTDAINNCVDKETYKNWVTTISQKTSTDKALLSSDGSFGTPTVFVNGKRWPNSGDFTAFITANS